MFSKFKALSTLGEKWNESGFRPPLCTYRLNWARRTSWGWWDDWDDTVLQTQDSKFDPWRSDAEHATSRSRRLPIILTFTRGWGRNNFVSFKPPRPGTEPRTLAWKAAVLTTTLGPPPTLGEKCSHICPYYTPFLKAQLNKQTYNYAAAGNISLGFKYGHITGYERWHGVTLCFTLWIPPKINMKVTPRSCKMSLLLVYGWCVAY